MAGYDLDKKGGGLFGIFSINSPSKIIKPNDQIEMKHVGSFDYFKSTVLESGEKSVKIKLTDSINSSDLSAGDHVILYFTSGMLYVLSGEIESINSPNPLEMTIRISAIEKMKNAQKKQRMPVCMSTTIKVMGKPENIHAVTKNISFNGVKFNCKEDIMLEGIIDVTVLLNSENKFICKGRVVRKNPMNGYIEYGVEVNEIGESSLKNLTRYINQPFVQKN